MSDPAVALDLTALAAWMGERGLDVDGPLEARRIGRGHSNLTYRVRDAAGRTWVARRPPLGELLASAHDVAREARIMAALEHTDVPVPRILATCEDPRVADVPVVLMEHVEGLVIDTEPTAHGLDPAVARGVCADVARTLARIHAVDVDAVGLGDLAKREDYAGRQLRRWSRQWEASRTRELPALDDLTAVLAAAVPPQRGVALVHGDFHLRNVLVDPADGTIRAALDWELSTLGDPVADIGSTLAYWPEAGEPTHGMFAGTAAPGFMTREELAEAYLEQTGADRAALGFWHVLGVWKIAVIVEGVVRRVRDQPENATEGEIPTTDQVDGLIEHAQALSRHYGLRSVVGSSR